MKLGGRSSKFLFQVFSDYYVATYILCYQQVSNGHWFDPGRKLLSDASLAQW